MATGNYVVGIDVGGQTTKIGVVDARGDVLAQKVIRESTFKGRITTLRLDMKSA